MSVDASRALACPQVCTSRTLESAWAPSRKASPESNCSLRYKQVFRKINVLFHIPDGSVYGDMVCIWTNRTRSNSESKGGSRIGPGIQEKIDIAAASIMSHTAEDVRSHRLHWCNFVGILFFLHPPTHSSYSPPSCKLALLIISPPPITTLIVHTALGQLVPYPTRQRIMFKAVCFPANEDIFRYIRALLQHTTQVNITNKSMTSTLED
jgi:hypothetical protein